ncbi:isoprenylcysteine carboxylmethyltransferase family protein [Pedobacter sp. HMF7647]|uniref:Isoprenylcysteine carboxylmethyltransferase family protein n=1 Tax=Hufsiella arboris TaxID=2695275 RepID=A0A7K1Y9V0_9SPHI|nr:isoprenylcysteine carboxylmethyltransferase family protein [Hufsiella arboris]MXV51376.1 isoprenylcysteine carboxylmethyltransferase family protein [Hufsiella arboris]
MISIGNFFFKYRNILFIFLYLALFIPSPNIFRPETFGDKYYLFPIIIGLIVTITGQLIRGATIGLAYIVRGGKDKKVYAEALVTEGIFNHGRNPLYVGNILMLVGVGILSNSLIYVCIFIPLFLFIYQAIVLAEENFLRSKFGDQFDEYCNRVNRWWISLKNIGQTFSGMRFNYKRWILKEYNTQYVWLAGIALILLTKYRTELLGDDETFRNTLLIIVLLSLTAIYLFVRYMKKSKRLVD